MTSYRFDHRARVLEVHDGDTVRLAIDLGFRVSVSEPFRLLGLDAPELLSANPDERAAAVRSRDTLVAILGSMGPLLTVETHVLDEPDGVYGRYLADIIAGDTTVSARMLQWGHARPYDGRAKRAPWTAIDLAALNPKVGPR